MKCVIPGTNIKVFGRAIHSLSKIGEELYIEPLDHGLALRTVNSSRSAYACFLFAPSFFQHYDDGAGEITSQDSEDSLRCKIAMKSILTVFRSLSTMEKTVERCKVHLNMKESRLVFQLHCRHGIVKTHNLAFIECETLQAVFSKDMCPNALTASSKLLGDAVLNFQNNQEEVTLIVCPEKIVLKNYVEDEPDPNRVMHTNLSLAPEEFDNCQIGVDTEITFCLKELRAILAFSEATTLPVTLQFETAGRPVVFTIDSDSTFEGSFVLATLADQPSSQAPSQARHTQSRPSQAQHSQARPSQRRVNKPPAPRPQVRRSSPSKSQRPQEDRVSSRQVTDTRDMVEHSSRVNSSAVRDQERSQRLGAAYEDLMNDDDDDILIDNTTVHGLPSGADTTQGAPSTAGTTRTSISDQGTLNEDKSGGGSGRVTSGKHDQTRVDEKGDKYKSTKRVSSPVPGCSKDDYESPVIPVLGTKAQFNTTVTEDVDDDGEEEDELVPGTPPAKRFRSLFFGSSQASTQQSQKPQSSTSRVLAADTDDED